jgi:bifunctional non-homologous end joining protein LigD
MGLRQYRQKRQFEATPEPPGKERPKPGPLRFVVQKHQATRLHYDLRLELKGTLKSWAIPKGPSVNPQDKRLAVMVEDHPLEYQYFEGIIPKGNYGAGTVMVWDAGTYHSRQTTDREESEKLLEEGLRKGHITFILEGRKLKGEFALVKLKAGDENAWLLLKKRDEFASLKDVTLEDRSVLTHRTLEEIAAASPSNPAPESKRNKNPPALDLSDAPKSKMPRNVKPMLATLAQKPFNRPGWLFEIKWDGYRAIAEVEKGRVRLYSRNQLSLEDRFGPIVEALRDLGHDAVLDGEVVVVDETGKPNFQWLQNYPGLIQGQLLYYVFDLLYLDAHDLCKLPLVRRKDLLKRVSLPSPRVQVSDHIEEEGIPLFKAASKRGLEGIVAKDGESRYLEGRRSTYWLKVKTHHRQEAVIGGFTQPRGSRSAFGALLLGVYAGKDLIFIGQVGTGFSERTLAEVRSRLNPLIQKTCPFKEKPKTSTPVSWVKPKLVCEVKFQNWTAEGLLRQPVFLGLREDKTARDVHREIPEEVSPETKPKPAGKGKESEEVLIGGRLLKLTNLQKIYWPKEKYTKGDLIAFYREIGPYILPYLKDRPLSLHRHPDGIEREGFYQKDLKDSPSWLQTVKLHSESGKRDIRYALCQDEASLIYLANLGCIEFNPWSSRLGTLERPDYVVIDLDPGEAQLDPVVEAALQVKKVLERGGAQGFCKTSGKRGLHVYVPLGARYSYDQALRFAEIIANLVQADLPESTTLARSPAQRKGRVYLDYLQNRRSQTVAAPYAARPYPKATVSTPLKWEEVKPGLDPSRFTIRTLRDRLARVGDLWKPVLGPGVDILQCVDRLRPALK